jgi:capsular polysaccharide biosynthesis protein
LEEIDLRDYIDVIRKRIKLLAVVPLIAVLVAAVAVFWLVTPVYTASTTLMVNKSQPTNQIVYSDLQANLLLVKTYREVARSRVVMDEVLRDLNLSLTAEALSHKVDVTQVGDTQVIRISVDDPDAVLASRIANSVGNVFQQKVVTIMQVDNVVTIDRAVPPNAPTKPNKALTLSVALVLGGMTGLGLIFLLEFLDNTMKTSADVEKYLGLPVLGMIPTMDVPTIQSRR